MPHFIVDSEQQQLTSFTATKSVIVVVTVVATKPTFTAATTTRQVTTTTVTATSINLSKVTEQFKEVSFVLVFATGVKLATAGIAETEDLSGFGSVVTASGRTAGVGLASGGFGSSSAAFVGAATVTRGASAAGSYLNSRPATIQSLLWARTPLSVSLYHWLL